MEKSESIKELSAALVKFAGLMIKVGKDAANPFFKNKYASLSNIIEVTQKPLADCGLAVIQMPAGENQLTTMLVHSSGEYIAETYTMKPVKSDPQGLGSAITYQRRYAMGAVLNLNIDEDDDGNQASAEKKPYVSAKVTPPKRKPVIKEATQQMKDAIAHLTKGGNWAQIDKHYEVPEKVRESINTAVKAQLQTTKTNES